MVNQKQTLNDDVTRFLDHLGHPLRKEIEQLREAVLSANAGLYENIKWNSPNFCFNGDDRITMRIQPPKQIQLVFHRGAKVVAQPQQELICDRHGLLTWKTNDRAVATFKCMADITTKKPALIEIVTQWLEAASR